MDLNLDGFNWRPDSYCSGLDSYCLSSDSYCSGSDSYCSGAAYANLWAGALGEVPKRVRGSPGLKKVTFEHSGRLQVITFWRVFFSGKRRPSELNKFLHSCPAIFPLFFVIAQILNVQVQILTVQVQMFGLDATRLLTVAPRIYRYLRGFIDIYLILPFRWVLS